MNIVELNARISRKVIHFARGSRARDVLHLLTVPSKGSDYAKATAAKLRAYRQKPLQKAVLNSGNKGVRILDRDNALVAAYKTLSPNLKGQVLPSLEKAHARGPFDIKRNLNGETLIRETKRTGSGWSV